MPWSVAERNGHNYEHICYNCFQEKPEEAPVCPFCGFDEKEEQPYLALPMGTLLNGRYMTGRVLGVGGFGITYLGFDLTLQVRVAIKEYMPSGLATRHADRYQVVLIGQRREDFEKGMERFLEEARILAKLQNAPNIVLVQNYFKENGTAYFVMEYVDGMSLKAYLASQGGKIPYEQALTILLPVMRALSCVHSLNLTHRDISPDNISITSDGESKLLDFGAARFSIEDAKSVSVILKHGYAPEEQYSSKGRQGPWTDVYAIGATLYRCITGELPPDSIMRVHDDTLKKPSELGISIPVQAEQALMKAMAVKTEDRFQSMEEFIRSIDPDASYAQTVANSATKMGTMPQKRRKNVRLRVIAMVLGILSIGLGIWRIAVGIGALSEGKTGSPREALQPPDGVADVRLTDYTNDYFNIGMKIPESYIETEPGSGAFTSPDGNNTIFLGFFTGDTDTFPVYSLADVEKNANKYVEYFIGLLESTDVTAHEVLGKGYCQIGDANAYQILFSAAESGGTTMEFLATFVECQNGFGCYQIMGAYFQGDEQGEAEIWASRDSFISNGPSGTVYSLFSDERLPFRFIYFEEDNATEISVKSDTQLNIYKSGTDVNINIQVRPKTEELTKEGWLDGISSALLSDAYESRGARWTTTDGGVNWSVDDYATVQAGVTYYVSVYGGEVDGYVFIVVLTVDSTENLFDGTLLDVLKSVRPVR